MIIIDLETTGTLDRQDRVKVIEIGALRVNDHTMARGDGICIKVNPQEPLSEFIAKYTGLSDDILKDAPLFPEAYAKLKEFVNGETLAAWPVSFELPVLQRECFLHGMKFDLDRRAIDIGTICRREMNKKGLFMDEYSLDATRKRLHMDTDSELKRHSAFDDCVMEYDLLKLAWFGRLVL